MRSFFAGRVLSERYELTSSLGEGAAGEVWIARDLKLGIMVAVKILLSYLREDGEQRAQFEREAELCARMLSPHIVRVLGYGIEQSAPYIAYELLEGETLDARIRQKKLGLDEAEALVVQVGRALARAHSMQIVHKDIKPANVFLTKDERGRELVKVLDFGIAEVVRKGAASTGEISGTLGYMPLEVLRDGAPADARADLFALTVTTYEALAGEVPFPDETPASVVRAMLDPPPSLTRVMAVEWARPLDAWMKKGLECEPADRFQTARELAEGFHAAVKEAKRALGVTPPLSARRASQMNVPRIATPMAFEPRMPSPSTEVAPDSSRRAIPPAAPMRQPAPSFVFDEELASLSESVTPSTRDPRRE